MYGPNNTHRRIGQMKYILEKIARFSRSQDGATLIAHASIGLLILLIILTLLTCIGQQSGVGIE